LNYLDFIFLGIIAWYLYRGFKRGFILQIFSLVGIITAFIAAAFFSELAAELIKRKVPELESGINWIALVATFLLVLSAFYLAGAALTKLINLIFLKRVNQFLGLILGFFKASMVVMFLTYFTCELTYKDKPLISFSDKESSKYYEDILEISEKYIPEFFPNGHAERFRKRLSI
jgi:membrane protein required for colicin V production